MLFDRYSVDMLLKMYRPEERYIGEANIEYPTMEAEIWIPPEKKHTAPDVETILRQSIYLLYLNAIADRTEKFPKLQNIKTKNLDDALVLFPNQIYKSNSWPSTISVKHEIIHGIKDRYFFCVNMKLDEGKKSDIFGEIRTDKFYL